MSSLSPAFSQLSGDPAGLLGRVSPDSARAMVRRALTESHEWLRVAMQTTDPEPLVELRCWADALATAVRKRRLGGSIELDCAEILRWAERGVGVVVRAGQSAGQIRTHLDGGGVHEPGLRGSRSPTEIERATAAKASPSLFFTNKQQLTETYLMTDDVSDDRFDLAIARCKAEGNLSRANVIRKVRAGVESAPVVAPVTDRSPQRQKAVVIAEYAGQGYTSRQIAVEMNLTEETIRLIAKRFDVDIPADAVVSKTRRIDSNRVVAETVDVLEGLALSASLINISELDPDEIEHWSDSLRKSLRPLNRLVSQLSTNPPLTQEPDQS